ncbi:amino acid adenylation domain-containing protein [Halomonas sp. TRM85114]|uniref:Pls/PosA family non-ribosomal peptide synthetase n=1 Tax=Halomonas jincaotanensis TaxID=2810616 RepID=UPI001BD321A4|nr:Pls/PosA family non-ribosomal peptide synthetase [Halomonas jincaotanensis]MBS9402756.1 amino acid adenylation domain-containing protein [Halomonas jincaotanensis]
MNDYAANLADVLVSEPLVRENDLEVALTRDGDTRPRWQSGERLHHLFEAVAEQWPDAIAVETPEASLSFAELDTEANRLARLLENRGIGANDVVALLFDRNLESYIALLAVLKLHAVYVPLDPMFPPDRIYYIAADAGASTILTIERHKSLAEAANLPILSLDSLAAERRDYSPDSFLAPEARGELAYIIYTSGSTGKPKGVRITHHSIVNFVRVAAETYGYRPGDRVYQGLTLAFDFSVEEIWVPLLVGATLVPSQAKGSLVGEDLHAFLTEHRITAICCVPTLLSTIEEESTDLPDLRLLIVSGEACPVDIVRRWHRDDRMILNAYGPTEATVTATVAELRPNQPITIGSPLPSYSVVILDPDGPVALEKGEVGEIGIAGIGLSPGYVGRDDLTQKVFIEDFLGLPDNPSGRIYRTGDLGRIDGAGQVEYLGRIDTQVKIRGYRIELTEIESVIMQQPGIVQAVVDTFEPEPGTRELVAYYTTSTEVAPEQVANALSEQLPSFMVPAYYEPLEVIAMLPSDKADRRLLPPPSGKRLVRGSDAFVAPDGEVETRLAGLLADLLTLERVSVTHDFFADLGTNSLIMARFCTRVRREMACTDISMRDIYQAPTVRELAARVGALMTSATVDAPQAPRQPAPHVASDLAYWGTGCYQLLMALLVGWGMMEIVFDSIAWMLETRGVELYLRAAAFSLIMLVIMMVLPIAAKWLLIGRWQEVDFPIWGVNYARFWLVKSLIQASPLARVKGTPLYNAYLKSLGVRVDWSAMVMCNPPVCTDLVEIGPQAVVGREVMLQGYKAVAGRIVTGPVHIGARAYVGDGAVLDIHTRLEDGAELAHASALYEGQVGRAGVSYHGTPAEATTTRFRVLPPGTASLARRIGYTLAQLGTWVLGLGPALFIMLTWVIRPVVEEGLRAVPVVGLTSQTLAVLPKLLGYSAAFFVGSMLLGLVVITVVPRLVWRFLQEDREYPLYGVRYYLVRMIIGGSNSKFFNLLFGDSSYIVYYLGAIGYRFNGLKQSGSNFGVHQRHDVPFLCEFGYNTMVSDNLVMANATFSGAAFRLGRVRFGRDNFLGNDIHYPAGGRTGDNVLFGTKTLVPVDGELRENTGLLGSPAFEIPRSVMRDRQFDHYKAPEVLAARLRLKNRHNLMTMALFLLARYVLLALMLVVGHALVFDMGFKSPFELTVTGMFLTFMSCVYVVLVERASFCFRDLSPQYCAILDDYFWRHERFWKMNVLTHLNLFNGTPFKGLMWRGLNVRVGRKLYDEGCGMPEKSLVTIGDHCTLNAGTTIQAHSLEDGIFKSDHVTLGEGATLGVKSFVHYGTVLGEDSRLEADSFLMKGERMACGSRWHGNPARPVLGEELAALSQIDTLTPMAVPA